MKLAAIPTMLSMVPSVFRGVDLHDLETIKTIVRQTFPSVSQLSTGTLANWMEARHPLLLIDVRSNKEFAVSHLRNAFNLRSAREIAEVVKTQKPAKIILYCSVGFRSSRLAHALARDGNAEVMNLEGSIFQWANEGRALYRGEAPTSLVHPYGSRWAGLLKPGLASEA
jgi:rhodanese-related sulfurtransferase